MKRLQSFLLIIALLFSIVFVQPATLSLAATTNWGDGDNNGKINAGDALIVLKDNGNGLLIQDTDMLFQLNYQGSNHISGTGLGLAQAKAATKACGGDIWCKTSPNKGFAIYLRIPVCTRVQKQPQQ